jgi:hypothetical protein
MERVTLNLKARKQPRRHVGRRQGVIDSFRPLTFQAAALDLDVECVHVFPEKDGIVCSFVTGRGSATLVMPLRLARELGDGLSWLVAQESGQQVAFRRCWHARGGTLGSA